jgi:hypothetical protein
MGWTGLGQRPTGSPARRKVTVKYIRNFFNFMTFG